jgi:alpha-mannosidase
MEYEIVSTTTDNGESAEQAASGAFAVSASPTLKVASGPAIAMTLIRAVGDLSRNDLATRPSGHAGPPVATPAAQCLGLQRFELAFEPRGAAPLAGELMASARAHNIPPRIAIARLSGGTGPLTRSFLHLDREEGDVVLSALKQADDRSSVIVRVFNPGDEEARAVLSTGAPIKQAFLVNFLEERQDALAIENDRIELRIKPKKIHTIELVS